MAEQRVVVRRNTDDTALRQLFGSQMAANAQSSYEVGKEKFKDEPWSYIPNPGVSTFRGSRSVIDPEGTPYGSPADVVMREVIRNPDLIEANPKDIQPYGFAKNGLPNNIVDKTGSPKDFPPPPTQEDSIPEEYRAMMQKQDFGTREYVPPVQAQETSSVISHPRQFTPEDIPSAPEAYHPAPPPPPKDVILKPVQPDRPHKITEDMIIKISGYNETNMYLLTEVSKNIAFCSETISKLNNLALPINVTEILNLLEYMDQETLRKTLSNAFEEVLKTNVELSRIITTYLNGAGSNSAPTDVDNGTSESDSQTTEESSQDAPGNSVSPANDESVDNTN